MKIAAVIPAYNSEKTIGDTLDSIVNQTHQCNEIIVVDDGSTDGTHQVVKRYSKVKYIHKENSGVSDSRNMGVDVAESEWIAFCDSDDLWHPEKINICEKVLKDIKPKCKLLFHDFDLFGSDLAIGGHYTAYGDNSIFSVIKENKLNINDVFESKTLLKHTEDIEPNKAICVYWGNVFRWLILGNFILPSTVIVEKKYFLNSRGFDTGFVVAEDTEYFLRSSKKADFGFVGMPLTQYRWVRSGLTSNLEKLLYYGMKALVKNTVEEPECYKKYRKVIHLAVSRRYARAAYYWLTEGENSNAYTNAQLSIKYEKRQLNAFIILIFSIVPSEIVQGLGRIKRKTSEIVKMLLNKKVQKN